eukprot:1335939-Amorphochlora_amoeboformis.AAC.1
MDIHWRLLEIHWRSLEIAGDARDPNSTGIIQNWIVPRILSNSEQLICIQVDRNLTGHIFQVS